jgi:hypothetical protein
MTKKTSLFEKDLAFLDKYHTGKAHKIAIIEILKRYKFEES